MTESPNAVREFEGLFIDGTTVPAVGQQTFDVLDPATGAVLSRVARASSADVGRAVESSARAFEKVWSRMPVADRARILYRISQRIRERGEELALLESADVGKPLRQARADVAVAARYFEFYAGASDKIYGDTIPLAPEFLDFTVREPMGVSAQIVPWNYPLQLSSRGIAPALAAGCSVVAKPSTLAPLSTLRIAEIAVESGLPPGVLNVLPGTGGEAGEALVRHPKVDQITFTGSLEVGVQVAAAAARNVVPVNLELGGKSPNIVFADSDLDAAVATVQRAIFQNAGQTCSAGSRLLVETSVHDDVLERLTSRVQTMKLGRGINDPDMGPVISLDQLERVEGFVHQAVDEGAHAVAGGARPTDSSLAGGFFFEPTVMDGVSRDMAIAHDEVFGPVLSVLTFDGVEDAVELANGIDYGLVAAIWTRDIDKALVLADRIRAGQIFINTYFAGTGVELPFGGYKRSGYGREKGLEALRAYTQVKNVCVRVGGRGSPDGH